MPECVLKQNTCTVFNTIMVKACVQGTWPRKRSKPSNKEKASCN